VVYFYDIILTYEDSEAIEEFEGNLRKVFKKIFYSLGLKSCTVRPTAAFFFDKESSVEYTYLITYSIHRRELNRNMVKDRWPKAKRLTSRLR